MTGRTRRFLNSAKWLSTINVTQSMLAVAVGIVLARSILPTVFGEFALLLALAEGLSLLTGFGINTSILQNTTHPERDFQNTGFFLSFLLVAGYLLVAAFAGIVLVPGRFFAYLVIVTGKAVLMLSGVHGILLQKDFRFRHFSLIQFGAFAASSSVAILLALRGLGFEALVWQYVLLQALVALSTVSFSPFRVSPRDFFHRGCARSFMRNGRQLFTSQMVEKLLTTVDKIWVSRALGAPTLAFFNRSIGLMQRFQSLFLSVLQPLLNVSFADLQSDRDRSAYFFNTSSWVIVRASMMLTLVFVAAPREFVFILYGETWLFAATLIPLVAPLVFLTPVRSLARNFLLSNGHFVTVGRIQIAELLVFLAALGAGARVHGIEGICVGMSAWMLASVTIYLSHVGRVIRLQLLRTFLVPASLIAVVTILNGAVRAMPSLAAAGPVLLALSSTGFVLTACGLGILAFERAQVRALIRRIRS